MWFAPPRWRDIPSMLVWAWRRDLGDTLIALGKLIKGGR